MDEIRLMIPRRPHDLPEWEISRDGHVIGWVQEWRTARGSHSLYRAIGIDPDTGQQVNLESSGDREERIRAVHEFHDHPEASVHRLSGRISGSALDPRRPR